MLNASTAGVLQAVDQQVADPLVELEGQVVRVVGRRRLEAEQAAEEDLGEVDLSRLGYHRALDQPHYRHPERGGGEAGGELLAGREADRANRSIRSKGVIDSATGFGVLVGAAVGEGGGAGRSR